MLILVIGMISFVLYNRWKTRRYSGLPHSDPVEFNKQNQTVNNIASHRDSDNSATGLSVQKSYVKVKKTKTNYNNK